MNVFCAIYIELNQLLLLLLLLLVMVVAVVAVLVANDSRRRSLSLFSVLTFIVRQLKFVYQIRQLFLCTVFDISFNISFKYRTTSVCFAHFFDNFLIDFVLHLLNSIVNVQIIYDLLNWIHNFAMNDTKKPIITEWYLIVIWHFLFFYCTHHWTYSNLLFKYLFLWTTLSIVFIYFLEHKLFVIREKQNEFI